MKLLSLGNLAIYSAQLLLVVFAATLGARIVRLAAPRPRLAFWRAVVVACLLLPIWPTRIDVGTISATQAGVEHAVPPVEAAHQSSTMWLTLIPWILLSGTVVRGAWLASGALYLRRLRVRSRPAAIDGEVEAMRRTLAPGAELRWDDRIDQPLTFGFWRPIVLLPRRLNDLSVEAQRAVVCHELLHVSRHDWAWTLVEEVVQTAFWFHPAMWWALGEVQLSREEVVDERVVTTTGVRRPYMQALMMFAEARPAVASAIPYVRRRHLASRLKTLSQEAIMSPARLVLTGAALGIVILGSSVGVVSTLPLHASARAATPAGPQSPAALPLKPMSSEPVNLTFRNTALTDILRFIGRASGISITYEEGFVDIPKVSVALVHVTVEEALDQILKQNGLAYKVIDEHSILVGRRGQ